jgi:hypothetical protein
MGATAAARAACAADDPRPAAHIHTIHAESGNTYGSLRVHVELRATGTLVNRRRRAVTAHNQHTHEPGSGFTERQLFRRLASNAQPVTRSAA